MMTNTFYIVLCLFYSVTSLQESDDPMYSSLFEWLRDLRLNKTDSDFDGFFDGASGVVLESPNGQEAIKVHGEDEHVYPKNRADDLTPENPGEFHQQKPPANAKADGDLVYDFLMDEEDGAHMPSNWALFEDEDGLPFVDGVDKNNLQDQLYGPAEDDDPDNEEEEEEDDYLEGNLNSYDSRKDPLIDDDDEEDEDEDLLVSGNEDEEEEFTEMPPFGSSPSTSSATILDCDDDMPPVKKKRTPARKRKKTKVTHPFLITPGKSRVKGRRGHTKPNWKNNCCIRGKRVGHSSRTFLSSNLFHECKERSRILGSRMSRPCKIIFWNCCEAKALRC